MMCDVIVSQILLFLEGRSAGMARLQHLSGSIEGFMYMLRKKRFDPIFGLCKMCDVIISQILSILDKR